MDTDLAPVRMKRYSEKLGYLDLHPFILKEDGTCKQADFELEADFFCFGVLDGKTIPCISAKGQKVFHTGYELREVDQQDLEILKQLH